jgi:peptidoglycan-associated lipoprotein
MAPLKEEVRVINWRNIAFCPVVVLWAVLGFAGCSSTVTQPESSSTTAANPPAESNTESAPTPIPAPSTSSLEAFQRGESTATPASSPLKEVYFEFDSYDLRADARATLKANADWLRDNPSVAVDIEGHCDERGTNDYNMALGAKRAQAAMDYLTTLGVASSRLSTTSYGEELLVCEEHTEECWAKNRRDRFVIQPARPAS